MQTVEAATRARFNVQIGWRWLCCSAAGPFMSQHFGLLPLITRSEMENDAANC